jgi:CRISPR-associated endonuclease/helicase Cas3
MTLTADDFGAFFATLHGGWAPFAWQRRLLDQLLATGRWPERVIAPTGAGKTAVIDVHVFAVALMAAGTGPRVPRRLSLVVDRRALVDSQYDLATGINTRLDGAAPADGCLGEVAGLLRGLRSDATTDRPPITVALLRGGIVPARTWVDDPTACLILCATPDMWGSRLLLRGYGTGRLARPREAGLLAYDSVIVVDEAHLARQLVFTARRIAELEAMAAAPLPVPALQVVEATATPLSGDALRPVLGIAASAVGVDAADLTAGVAADADLVTRLLRPKPLALQPDPAWPATAGAARAGLASRMADAADELLAAHGRTVACVANTVATALAAATELKKRGRTVELLVGRLRPHDVARLRARRPGLLTVAGDPDVDVVVATQTIEVGIDADFSAMVTEVAPGSALAQRAGRVNRLGTRAGTAIRVVTPAGEIGAKGAPPYAAADLTAALPWLTRRAATPEGLAPWAITGDPPPPQALRRVVLQRPEPWDAWLLARTSDDLVDEPDLDLWLADDLETDTDVAVVVRQGLAADPSDAIALLRATPPRAAESFPASIGLVRERLAEDPAARHYVWRDDEPDVLADPGALRPGDVVIIDDETRWFEQGVVAAEGTAPATDAFEEVTGLREPFALRIGAGSPLDVDTAGQAARHLLPDLVAAWDAFARDGRDRRRSMAAASDDFVRLVGLPDTNRAVERLRHAQRLLRARLVDADVEIGPRTDGGDPTWIVVTDSGRHAADDDTRQTWSAGGGAVPLEDHLAGVAARAAAIADRVDLPAALGAVLEAAGRLHDEGKRDPRFQRMLRGDGGPAAGTATDEQPLAKSGLRTPGELRVARATSGLSTGWRHEQLSAAVAHERAGAAPEDERALVTRLVGTSHGHGRTAFPHQTAGLVGTEGEHAAASRDLHDDGAWDAIVERTHRRHGVWGCAYLEALLRAADGQVSGEGR